MWVAVDERVWGRDDLLGHGGMGGELAVRDVEHAQAVCSEMITKQKWFCLLTLCKPWLVSSRIKTAPCVLPRVLYNHHPLLSQPPSTRR